MPGPATRQVGDEGVIAGRPSDAYRGRILGLAADIATITVALKSVDLESRKVAGAAYFENPQRFGGSDVMRRISRPGGSPAILMLPTPRPSGWLPGFPPVSVVIMGKAALAGGHVYAIVTIARGVEWNRWRGGFSILN